MLRGSEILIGESAKVIHTLDIPSKLAALSQTLTLNHEIALLSTSANLPSQIGTKLTIALIACAVGFGLTFVASGLEKWADRKPSFSMVNGELKYKPSRLKPLAMTLRWAGVGSALLGTMVAGHATLISFTQ